MKRAILLSIGFALLVTRAALPSFAQTKVDPFANFQGKYAGTATAKTTGDVGWQSAHAVEPTVGPQESPQERMKRAASPRNPNDSTSATRKFFWSFRSYPKETVGVSICDMPTNSSRHPCRLPSR